MCRLTKEDIEEIITEIDSDLNYHAALMQRQYDDLVKTRNILCKFLKKVKKFEEKHLTKD